MVHGVESKSIDALILTPLSQELRGLRAELGQSDDERAETEFSYVIWRSVELKGRIGSVVAVMPLEKDQLPAANATHLALERWSPGCFVLMGIAGQLSTKVALGDVVVGRHVLQWDSKRKEMTLPSGVLESKYALTPAPGAKWGANLANLFKSDAVLHEKWTASCWRDRPSELSAVLGGRLPECHVEDIASGSATIDSDDMREMLSGLSRYLYAVETEAAGALSAYHSRNPTARSVVIRGVSDPSSRKNDSDAVGEGAWRRYAARNAAKLLRCVLRDYELRAESVEETSTRAANVAQSPQVNTRSSLVEVLRERAASVVAELDTVIDGLRSALPDGVRQESVRQLEEHKMEFTRLHEKHIVAVRAGDVHLTHEIVGKIYGVLEKIASVVSAQYSTVREAWWASLGRRYNRIPPAEEDPKYHAILRDLGSLRVSTVETVERLRYPGEAPQALADVLRELGFGRL